MSFLSICSSTLNNSSPTGRFFMKFNVIILRKSVENVRVWLNLTTITGLSRENQCTLMIYISLNSSWNEKISHKIVEKLKTHILYSVNFYRKSFRLWDDVEKYGRAAIGHIWPCDAWIRKAANTLAEYVLLTAFPLQQWLHERASVLRSTYIACIVCL
jgi:hypothetical protein